MKKHFVLVVVLALVLAATPAYANYYCQGTLTQVTVTSAGIVVVQGAGGIPGSFVCQLGVTANGFTPDACKATYAMLLAARLAGQPVVLTFNDNLSCSTQPVWNYMTGLINVNL